MKHLKHKYYFIGIGGVGMSALARLCLRQGHQVVGYDKTASPITRSLEEEGIYITYDTAVKAIPKEFAGTEVKVIYTAAISNTHPQLAYYLSQGNQTRKRAVFLADLSKKSKLLAISGTHGKTTTSAILTHIFSESECSFSSLMGGFLNGNNSNLIGNGEEFMIVEADEYDRSFLQLHPNIACVTSMDPDHLDIYKTAVAFETAFVSFSNQVKDQVIVNFGLPLKGLTYGVEVAADYNAFNIQNTEKGYSFDLKTPKGEYQQIIFNQFGKHNIANSVCAIAMADQAGVPLKKALKALENFPGVHRRMNVFEWGKALVVDDYAHHPTEIRMVLETIKTSFSDRKNCVIFQPHLFSRTQDFMEGFVSVLEEFDEVAILDIYPAREEPIPGVDAFKLLKGLNHTNKKHIKKEEIESLMRSSDAGVFAFLGAGDIGLEVQALKQQIEVV